MDAGSTLLILIVIVIGVLAFMSRNAIKDFFQNAGTSISDTVTGTHIVTKSNQTEGQVLGQRVVSDVGTGQPAISGEANQTLKFFPFAVKNNAPTNSLNQTFQDKAKQLGRPLTLDETKKIISDFNKQQEKDFLTLGGFVQA